MNLFCRVLILINTAMHPVVRLVGIYMCCKEQYVLLHCFNVPVLPFALLRCVVVSIVTCLYGLLMLWIKKSSILLCLS